jgi:hypothetical protein
LESINSKLKVPNLRCGHPKFCQNRAIIPKNAKRGLKISNRVC